MQVVAAVGDENAKLASFGRVRSARLLWSYVTEFRRSRTGCTSGSRRASACPLCGRGRRWRLCWPWGRRLRWLWRQHGGNPSPLIAALAAASDLTILHSRGVLRRLGKRFFVMCITSRAQLGNQGEAPHAREEVQWARLIRATRRFFRRDGTRCSGV